MHRADAASVSFRTSRSRRRHRCGRTRVYSRRRRSTQVLNKSITLTTFNYLRRGLFEKDKLTVATLVTTRILVDNDLLPGEDVSYLFLGKVHPDPGISRRPAVLRRLHAIDARRLQERMS